MECKSPSETFVPSLVKSQVELECLKQWQNNSHLTTCHPLPSLKPPHLHTYQLRLNVFSFDSTDKPAES